MFHLSYLADERTWLVWACKRCLIGRIRKYYSKKHLAWNFKEYPQLWRYWNSFPKKELLKAWDLENSFKMKYSKFLVVFLSVYLRRFLEWNMSWSCRRSLLLSPMCFSPGAVIFHYLNMSCKRCIPPYNSSNN